MDMDNRKGYCISSIYIYIYIYGEEVVHSKPFAAVVDNSHHSQLERNSIAKNILVMIIRVQ